MDLGRLADLSSMNLQHRHSDGSWGSLEPRSHHDAADHDQEREWATGTIYVCSTCDEQVRVVDPADPQGRQPA